jgi:cell division protein FtsL
MKGGEKVLVAMMTVTVKSMGVKSIVLKSRLKAYLNAAHWQEQQMVEL